jgi:hypothetical protein
MNPSKPKQTVRTILRCIRRGNDINLASAISVRFLDDKTKVQLGTLAGFLTFTAFKDMTPLVRSGSYVVTLGSKSRWQSSYSTNFATSATCVMFSHKFAL